ncbi:helicase-associated domain-containing protein [Nakamurella sp.]|uniref:helicase-associated domain-containing protein n=1 Tax=Nakamurella sp. TaxID=1869182 RepID=UPI00378343C6
MSEPGTLLDFLTSRSPEQLAAILRHRTDVTWGAPIAGLDDLAERLTGPMSLTRALQSVPEPCLALCHAIVALGPSTTMRALTALLPDSDEPAERDAVVLAYLNRLQDLAVIWFDDDLVRHDPALTELIPRPMGLGLGVSLWLERLSRADVTGMAAACGLRTSGSAAEIRARLVALFTDPERLGALLADAPADARAHLEQLAQAQAGIGPMPSRGRAQLEGENWARRRGLLIGGDYLMPEVPCEVVLAIMGPRTRVAFAAHPPTYDAHAVAPTAIERGAAAAAAEATQSVAALVDRLGRTPATALKAGGVGTRELVKIGKALGVAESQVRFDLEILRDLGSLAGIGGTGTLGLSPAAGAWRATEPAQRYADLVAVWWTLPIHPSLDRDDDGKVIPAAGRRMAYLSVEPARGMFLSQIDEMGADRAPGSPAEVAGQLAWHRPASRPDDLSAAAVWREAHAIGVLVDGTLSPVGRCLLDGDADELVAVAGRLLPAAASSGRFGSDLTVLVAGSPSAAVSALLDACADREGRGAAVVWRFSPASVRRAFDEGWTAERLTSALRGLLDPAADADLPQTLTYLIGDVARRHGHLVVLPAASCVRSADPALLREVVADRRVRQLQPHLVTAEVAVFQAEPAEVVQALRAAGYLPVPADEHGVVDLRRPTTKHRRADVGGATERPLDRLVPTRSGRGGAPDHPDQAPDDAVALAQRLLRVAGAVDQAGPHTEAEEYVDLFAPHLSPLERRQLAFAIDRQLPVVITYQTATGGVSRRMISELELVGDQLYAWCHLRDDQREFNVGRIRDVQPAREGQI